ncbi:NHLP family bacteriocin export ABC transporter peptidase/permease/ATPase subunit [Synechococcus sp. RS9916]|uniref:NHLP family bacteriocin export ABC transporter peptidase/permease/ATPase subunit n=1 Tax=Synechococcus sp. RS9916 TaxID=221359 RepID=UPI0000E5353C|nr:NHLP family bacteriocin export ABC transporter peptidase/permease/ATPase subunit [Synechococcus sp. RS9916]EAU75141.1 ATPase [Synechococcus sp. RS9916]
MVRTPTVLQMENTECGAASLSIVLQHYGRYVPLTQLRELCGVSRDGSDAANLILAARSLGLDAKGFKKGIAALEEVKPPAILFWEFNHFLVFEGFRGDRVALNDPALGPRTVSREEFDRSYTGIVLTLEPGPEFQRGGRAPSPWPIVGRRLSSEPMGALFIAIAGLLLILPQLVMPVFAQIYLDEVIGNAMNHWLKPMLWAMALTIGLQVVLQHLQLVGTRSLEKRLTRRFAIGFEHQILALPERFYSQRHASDIASRMGINANIAEFIGGQLIPMATGLVLLVFYLILTFLYSPWLGLLILTTTAINALVVQRNLRTQKDANLALQKDAAKSGAVVVGAMRDIETIKAAALEHDVFRRFAGYQSRLLNTLQALQLRNARLRLIPNGLTTFNEVAVLLLGFLLVIRGDLTLGMLLAAQTIAFSLKGQIESVIGFVQQLPGFEAGVLRLEDVLEQPRDPLLDDTSRTDANTAPTRLSGKIEIDALRYGFTAIQAPLIDGLSLTIQPGMRVALVGGSGSGKSTLAKLLAGLHQPTGGTIRYDGHTLLELPRSVAVASLAMVQQEIQLFGCSVRDNLSLWNRAISDAALLDACRDAEVLDVVRGLPDGLDTQLSEGGRNLSGGQRQRLELARALVNNPSILIMDEATSALDAETERKLIANLARRGCTQIIVAHRLSTIRDADLILVMEQGQVIQRGTHAQLVQDTAGAYAQLLSEVS